MLCADPHVASELKDSVNNSTLCMDVMLEKLLVTGMNQSSALTQSLWCHGRRGVTSQRRGARCGLRAGAVCWPASCSTTFRSMWTMASLPLLKTSWIMSQVHLLIRLDIAI